MRSLVSWWDRHERRLSAVSLIAGFLFDLFIAKRPDSLADNILLLSYLLIAAVLIVVLNLRDMRRRAGMTIAQPVILLLILQFCFGGLASNLLVLYGKSGTLTVSALFLALLAAMLIGNEFLKTRYEHLRFNIGVYYLLLFTYCIIAVPTFITHRIGAGTFVLSGVISLCVVGVFLYVLYRTIFNRDRKRLVEAVAVIAAVFLFFNGLYFLRVIPPVPLSVKDIGIYHSVLRSGGGYDAQYEPAPWWEFWSRTNSVFTRAPGDSAYCFSSVFAPTDVTVPIYHRWLRYDENVKEWRTVARVSFPIAGGRDEGYRGYTVKMLTEAGRWRCDVETEDGRLIGRAAFTVQDGSPAVLQSITL